MAEFVELETGSLRAFGRDEKWLQERIAENPEILGIRDVFLHTRERRQPRAGCLDLLLETKSNDKRYEVEIQLGATDPSHIIRTIEYWDLERQRSPQYDHCAVIVAEDITSRFFNVIGLFNRHLPIIAINVTAVKTQEGVGLVFTHVLNERTPDDDSESPAEQADQRYWLERWEKETKLAEHVCNKLGQKPRYTKNYIGMEGRRNSMIIHPRKNKILLRYIKLPPTKGWEKAMEEQGVDVDTRRGHYWLSMHSTQEIDKHIEIIRAMYRAAEGLDESSGEETESGDGAD